MTDVKLHTEADIRQWQVVELELEADREYQDPIHDVSVKAIFKGPKKTRIEIPGFWDGGKTWRVRFLPTQKGEWSFRTECSIPGEQGLHGKEGSLKVLSPKSKNPIYRHGGMLKVSQNKRYLTYSDGAPFYWLADTWWSCPSDLVPFDKSTNPAIPSMFKELISVRKAQGYSVTHWAFLGKLDGAATFEDLLFEGRVNPEYWQQADCYIRYANNEGIIPLIGFGWGHDAMNRATLEQLQVLWSYVLARFAAFPIVWMICGEYNFESNMVNWFSKPESERGPKPEDPFSEEDKLRITKMMKLGQFIKDHDPYRRATTIHPYEKHHAWDEPWYDFIMMQAGHEEIGHPIEGYLNAYHRENRKPILEGECTYEGIFAFSDEVIRKNAYKAIQCGAFGYSYGSHGLWYPHQDENDTRASNWGQPLPWWRALRRPGGAQMSYLRKCYEMVNWWELEPVRTEEALEVSKPFESERQIITVKANADKEIVIYFPTKQQLGLRVTLKLCKEGTSYAITQLDPRCGQVESLGTVKAGSSGLALPSLVDQNDWVMIVKRQD